MSKATNDNAMNKLNRIKPATNALFNVLFLILGLGCVIPILYVFMISITSEASITQYGYQFIPHEFSGSAYKFLWEEKDTILKALLISVEVTVIGTVVGVALTTLMGYVLSRPGYKLNGFLTIVVFIPMIFGGGMVANYVVVGQVLHMSNTLWALILPLCVSSFNVTISRTFFRTTIPDSIIESAKIDGARQIRQDRHAHLEAPAGHHRTVPRLRLLERLVPVLSVHYGQQPAVPAGPAELHAEEH